MASSGFRVAPIVSNLALKSGATTPQGSGKRCSVERNALNTLGAALRCSWTYLTWDTGPLVVGFFDAVDRLTHSIEPTGETDETTPDGRLWGFRFHNEQTPGPFGAYGRSRLCAILAALHHYRPPTKEVTSCAWFHEKAHPTSM